MTAKEKKTILSSLEEHSRPLGLASAQGKTWEETEPARNALAAVKTLSYSLGIPYEEITSAIDGGWQKGQDDHRVRTLYLDRETGKTVSRAELEQEFEQLKSDDPESYNYTFSEYLRDCLGKNGSLMEI